MSLTLEWDLGYTDGTAPVLQASCERVGDSEKDRPVHGLSERSDAELVQLAQAGDFDMFGELVRRYRNQVYGLAYHFVQNREEAWDLSQEAFAKAYRSINGFRGEGDFKSWLMRITANQCKDYFKKRRLPTVSMESAPRNLWPSSSSPGPGQAAQHAELGEAIREALAQLPEKQRRAFVLREFEGLPYAKMAEEMGCNAGTVMSRLHHARQKMRAILTAMGVVEERDND